MAPTTPYKGPVALGYSKYASPHMRQVLPANAAVSMSSIANTVADNILATKEQVAAASEHTHGDMKPPTAAAQLAIAQGRALKEDVESHTAKLSHTVSSTFTNTRKLLELIRAALQDVDLETLRTTEHLWLELEQLFEAAKGAKHALPEFLEKQRNSMALYHSSEINNVHRESQMEHDILNKKVNIQQELILEQQQAFTEHKARTDSQLQERDDLKEKVSRLTLEKGNLRTEVDKQSHVILDGATVKVEHAEKIAALEHEKDSLMVQQAKLEAEVGNMKSTITGMHENLQAVEKDITERFTAELDLKDKQLSDESAKVAQLDVLLDSLKSEMDRIKMEFEKVKEEKSRLGDKLTHVSREHANLFSKDKDQNGKLEALDTSLRRVREENAELGQRLKQLADVEAQNVTLLQKVDKSNEKITTLAKVEDENTKLKAMIEELKIAEASLKATSHIGQNTTLVNKVKALEREKEDAQDALADWKTLAEKSFMEYKKMLPKYEKADEYRLGAVTKAREVDALKLELATTKAKQSKSSGLAGDAAYRKGKYDRLLANYGN